MTTSSATATWEGGLRGGRGQFNGKSGVIQGSYSFATRFEGAKGTNPEELIAAAHASCLSMALSAGSGGRGHAAQAHHDHRVGHHRQGRRRVPRSPACGSRCGARSPGSTRRRSPRRRRRRRKAARCRRRSRATCRSSSTRGWHRSDLPHAGRRRARPERTGPADRARDDDAGDRGQPARCGCRWRTSGDRPRTSPSAAAGPTASWRWRCGPSLLDRRHAAAGPGSPAGAPSIAAVGRGAGPAAPPLVRRHSVAPDPRHPEYLRHALADAVQRPLVLRRHPLHRGSVALARAGLSACC